MADAVASRTAIAILLVLLACAGARVAAWNPFAHYAITHAAIPGGVLVYDSLPDSWPSRRGLAISDGFAWTHGVQRTGKDRLIPRIPIYALSNPGEVMYTVCRGMGARCGPHARATVLGFLVHDVEDREVHWGFSGGGTYDGWRMHPVKEAWADCVVYRTVLGRGFDARGDAKTLPMVPHGGDGALINQAEQDFNSNPANTQATLDAGQSNRLKTVETVSEIDDLIKKYSAELSGLADFITRNNCASLDRRATREGWSATDVATHYSAAAIAVRDVYTRHPF